MKKALITGITGQDGSYLAELLLEKGYEVHGLVRRVALEEKKARFSRINDFIGNVRLVLRVGDITDFPTLWKLIFSVKPDEIYHLAGQTNITTSFEDEFGTFKTNALSTHYLLSAVKEIIPQSRFYFAATSDLFGVVDRSPQDETTPFNPTSPYGVSKAAGFYLTKLYRNVHKIFSCSGICFSHESPRRGFDFVTRKISLTIAEIKFGLANELKLGNLAVKRDWGFAGDYAEAMWLMLQQSKPDDYVIGTGSSHSIQEFVELAFATAGLDWKKYIMVDEKLFRPVEAYEWRANSGKAQKILGWRPKVSFEELVKMMVENDLKLIKERLANKK